MYIYLDVFGNYIFNNSLKEVWCIFAFGNHLKVNATVENVCVGGGGGGVTFVVYFSYS